MHAVRRAAVVGLTTVGIAAVTTAAASGDTPWNLTTPSDDTPWS